MTQKQEKFISEYMLNPNATAAAQAAGYSAKTARFIGCKLLKNVEVVEELKRRRRLMANEKILTATQLQEFLSAVVRGEVNDTQLMTRLIGKGCSVVEKHEFTASTKDRLRAAELLGKMIGAFDKAEASEGANLFLTTMEKIYQAGSV